MVKKLKEKKVAKTIYLEPSTLEYIENCMVQSDRNISDEVNRMIKVLRAYRDTNDNHAVRLAEEAEQRENRLVSQDIQPQVTD